MIKTHTVTESGQAKLVNIATFVDGNLDIEKIKKVSAKGYWESKTTHWSIMSQVSRITITE